MSEDPAPFRLRPTTPILLDAASVVLFCVIGGISHYYGSPDLLAIIPFLTWPFLAGLVLTHMIWLWRGVRAEALVPGVLTWLVVAGGGIALRAASGQGTAASFVVVTAVVLAVLMIGWRVVVFVGMLRRSRRS